MSRRPYAGAGAGAGVGGEPGLGLSAAPALQTQRFYEDANDDRAVRLSSQIGALKEVSLSISAELDYQRNMMSEMRDDMDKTGGILGRTMQRFRIMAQTQTGSWMWILVLFVLAVILYVVFGLMTRRR
ncbi:protein transport protein bet1 [Polyrhizophydium stewartii]|uniref:Protein transport protein bet1 n=1 Tax=Polyrhizophydium stewartii TaxID=2732419 RepID=A0ABR4NI45_9FUNG